MIVAISRIVAWTGESFDWWEVSSSSSSSSSASSSTSFSTD